MALLERTDQCSILKLPVEIHQIVAEHLSVQDIARYIQSSPVIANTISDSVWFARYKRTFDYAFSNLNTDEKTYIANKFKTRQGLCKNWTTFSSSGYVHMQMAVLMEILDLVLESNARIIISDNGQKVVSGLNLDFLREYVGGIIPKPVAQLSPRKIRSMKENGKLIGPQGQNSGTDLLDHLFPESSGPPSPYSAHSRATRSSSKNQYEITDDPVLPYLQLSLTHIMLDPKVSGNTDNILAHSQAEVYKCYREEPIFYGPNNQIINVKWLLHVASFFKLHLKNTNEGILSDRYKELPNQFKPTGWVGKFQQGTKKLGKHWLGAYTFLDHSDIAMMRGPRSARDEVIIDGVTDPDNPFFEQELYVDFNITADEFPHIFETILEAAPAGPHITHGRTSVTPTAKYFTSDAEDWQWSGCIHSLPPQQGIPGWQRVSMMKCKLDENDSPIHDEAWAYEGVVLPGGNIMLGRWWCPLGDPIDDGQSYCGPFIFWQVYENVVAEAEAEAEASRKDALMDSLMEDSDPFW